MRTAQKTIPLTPEVISILDEQARRFEETFGRKPGPKDPLFFDVDRDSGEPVPISSEKISDDIIVSLAEAGMEPVLIWTFLKTDRVLIPGLTYTEHLTSRDWRKVSAARLEFERTQPDLKPIIDAARQRLVQNNYRADKDRAARELRGPQHRVAGDRANSERGGGS